jgi:enoyl-CoA hydratase/carnithine racemase
MSPFRGSAPFTSTWEHFRVERSDGVATITFTRPDRLNALTFSAYADLRDCFTEIPHRDDTRVVILRGEGRAFCSGGDVDDIIGATLAMRPDELLSFTTMTGEVVRSIRESPAPVIAAIQGTAAGAGSVLALASDFRVMGRSATFAFLFTKVGLAGADMGAAYLLPRLVGLGRATKLLMLGDSLGAAEAEAMGLVSDLVDDAEVDSTAAALAARLASGPWQGHSATKRLLSRELDMSLSGAVELEAMTQALLMKGDDYREFHAAFTGKRPPEWTGR